MTEEILRTENLSKSFPGVKALKDINFFLNSGEIHAVVGENGAGKSTLVKIISGILSPTEGEIFLKGEKVNFSSPNDAIEQGIGIVPQESNLVPGFNPLENIFLGQEKNKYGFINQEFLKEKFVQLADSLGVDIPLDKKIKNMGTADQKVVEIMRALNLEPDIMILDEPTASLDRDGIEKLFDLLKGLKDEGLGIIFISHHLDEIFEIADRVTVLRDGDHISTNPIEEVNETKLIKQMIEETVKEDFYGSKENERGEILLQAKNLSNEFLDRVSMEIYKGEIVGLAGMVGAGRTELAETIFGHHSLEEGKIFLEGEKININKTSDAIENGICLIPEERREKALIPGSSVKLNLTISSLEKISHFGLIENKKEKGQIKKIKDKIEIVMSSFNTEVKNLSGGNQQKVSFGKWIVNDQEYKLYIFDEPAQGIDVGVKAEMFEMIKGLAEEGAGVLLISSELTELINLSDRIYVLKEGKIKDEIESEKAEQEKILKNAL